MANKTPTETAAAPTMEELIAQLAEETAARKRAETEAAEEAAARKRAEAEAAETARKLGAAEEQAGQLIEELTKENQQLNDKAETLAARKHDGLPAVKVDGVIYQVTAHQFRTKKGDITAAQLADDAALCRELIAKGSHALVPVDGLPEDEK